MITYKMHCLPTNDAIDMRSGTLAFFGLLHKSTVCFSAGCINTSNGSIGRWVYTSMSYSTTYMS